VAITSTIQQRSLLRALIVWVWILFLLVGRTAPAKEVHNYPIVKLVAIGDVLAAPTRTFVITHGCGGTKDGDRFHRLAAEVKREFPDANVFLLDWSAQTREEFMGFPNPWAIARTIDPSSNVAAELLQQQRVESSRLTLVGESFGVYINHRIAKRLGKVAKVLAFNPGSELGGYAPPILQNDAARVCVFTTTSMLDCHLFLADHALRIATVAGMNPIDQHTYGVEWLCDQLEAGDATWLELSREFPAADVNYLSGIVSADGSLDVTPILRIPVASDVGEVTSVGS
jgi:hypothetical protein